MEAFLNLSSLSLYDCCCDVCQRHWKWSDAELLDALLSAQKVEDSARIRILLQLDQVQEWRYFFANEVRIDKFSRLAPDQKARLIWRLLYADQENETILRKGVDRVGSVRVVCRDRTVERQNLLKDDLEKCTNLENAWAAKLQEKSTT